MYIEFEPGMKYAKPGADRSDTPDSFRDCGYLLKDDDIVIDIDHLSMDTIHALIREFNIKTQIVWTERGVHFYYKRPPNLTRIRNGVCKLGFEIEMLSKRTRPNGVTIKRNGVLRRIDNEGQFQYLPDYFTTGTVKKPYENCNGLGDGENRNTTLFKQRKLLAKDKNAEKYLAFINNHVFSEPMGEDEFDTVTRELDEDASVSDRFFVATEVLDRFHVHKYGSRLWWYSNGEYIYDEGNDRLIRRVYGMCEGQETRYVKEVIEQIEMRAPLVDGDTVFPIKFRNGVLKDGKFVTIKNFTEFTPYFIDINYSPNAEPVKVVDEYISNLTSGNHDYRKLLMEVIGYVLITDPEKIRSLGKFFMFRGDGANGKGTLLQIMKKIYGKRNCTALSIKQLVDDRYKATMIGKLANLGDDVEASAITDDQLKVLKNISTADTVATRVLYKQGENATFTTKLYFTTNSDIKSFEKGYAYKRRVVWLPMFTKVEKPDPHFISKLTSEKALEYWISLIVEGYFRLYETGEWTRAKLVEDYNEAYHENNDLMRMFAKDLDPDTEILGRRIKDLKETFYEWNSDEGKFSSKLFQNAVWDLYGIGIGRTNGRRVFIYQSTTSQVLQH